MRRRTFVAGALSAFGAPTIVHADDPRQFRVAVDTLGSSLDPYRDHGSDLDRYAWIFGDGLTTGERVPRPSLAEIPTEHDGGRTYRYELRSVRWHDGAPLRPSHISGAFRSLLDATSPWLTYEPYSLVDDIAIKSGSVFEVHLHRASTTFVRTFFSPYGHPGLPVLRHNVDGDPIGTGPFRISRRSGDRYAFRAYGGSPRGPPASEGLDVRLVPSATTLGLELSAGEVDLALPIVLGIPAADRYRIVSRYNGIIVLLFNCAAAFHTPDLRRAVLRAIDVDELQRTIDPGIDTRVRGMLQPGSSDDMPFPFPARDRDRARLELRGITSPITLVYLAESRRYARLALLLAQMLEAVGMNVDIVPRQQAVYQSSLGPLRTGRFDIGVYGFPYGDVPNLAGDWSCGAIPPHGANYARLCDDALDRAVASGAIRDALRVLLNDVPVIPLARNVESFGIGPRALGFEIPPPFVPPTISAHRWQLRPL
jgi:ABC-type transport system substrate-binding protein